MNGTKDHVWSLMAGSLYILGVKKDVKRAEQMEGEKEREREAEWADGEVLGRKELFSEWRCEDITVQGKKIPSEEIEGRNTTIVPGYKTEMQRLCWQ